MAASSSPQKTTAPPRKKARKSRAESSSSEVEDQSGATSEVSPSDTSDAKPVKKSGKKQNAKPNKSDPKRGKKNASTKGDKAKKGKRKAKSESDDEDEDAYSDGDEESNEESDGEESDDGGKNTRVVKTIKKVAAPKSSPDTSVILPTTMEFLAELRKNNDRDWFSENDARYRHALANFKAFMVAWTGKASDVDWQLPHLPTKDLIHRIYRDVRFSKDKTPYKTNLAFSHSRTGRKGPFAFYYFQISPGGRSLLAAGCWQPGSTELKAIRQAILNDPQPLRDAIGEKEFVELYGEPTPRMDGKRQSIFGLDDQLKNAPKLDGVDKTHKDIDLLKCRSIAVESTFTDKEVCAEDFLEKVLDRMRVTAPFVQLLNEFISPSPPSDDDEEADSGGEEQEDDEEEGEDEDQDEE